MQKVKKSFGGTIRSFLLGKPIASSKAHDEKLSPLIGLPVLASDALSSVAYGTEAIAQILMLGTQVALLDLVPIALCIAVLIAIIATSYNQTIHAYPSGGGSYIVASENLGETAGLIAGAALLIDYVLTVSVSIAAGVAAIISAFPGAHIGIVSVSLAAILLITYVNLRGVKESGTLFMVPVYTFIFSIVVMILLGLWRAHGNPLPVQHVVTDVTPESASGVAGIAAVFLLLRAFAAGCTALTGVEAVSNGIPVFKDPASKNASTTLKWMATILISMFLGISILSRFLPHVSLISDSNNPDYRSLVSQVAEFAFGSNRAVGFYIVQFSTAVILVLAANTSFADFPRLSSLLARDGFLPRSLSRLGDRLVFHNGILILGVLSAVLIIIHKGQLDSLLPLYAVGVFSAFTLSQAGMVVHWNRLKTKEKHWKHNAFINGIGAFCSGVVLVIIFVTKFKEGAYEVAILMAVLFALFKAIKLRYKSINRQLTTGSLPVVEASAPDRSSKHVVVLLVPRVHRGILEALEYARLIKGEVHPIHVTLDNRNLTKIQMAWEKQVKGINLEILPSPFRSLIRPVLDYVDGLHVTDPNLMVTVIVPEAISLKMHQKLLQENVGTQLKLALASRHNVVVTNVRYFLD